MKMGYNHADALNNTKYFFGYSLAGYAASFDNRDPAGVYLPHDSVLEHFVTAPGGAFAFIGNTRYGLTDLNMNNPDDSPSLKFDHAFWEEMFNAESAKNIGKVNQLSKETFIGDFNDDQGMNLRYCYYGINLLGDPETPFLMPSATIATTEEMPEAAGAEAPVTEEKVTEVPKAAAEAEKVTQISPSLGMPNLFEDGISFDANAFEFGEMEFDFGEGMDLSFGGGMDFGDSMNF
ncbi:MAG: hypothetical protein APR56_11245 [Methanosaeta sp. SDB]|nr:MAG: hypothetical protein APR56_11245 [Methanosaeta sp. SDB]